ncbi:MAG: hypothetical protein ACFFCS_20015 [Candidatus Hodarchaeota archaeon]
MTLISEIVKIVVIALIVLLGSAILRGLAKGIIKNEASESYGKAFAIAVLWGVFYYLFSNFGVDAFILDYVPDAWDFWVTIAIYWVFFLILVGAVYKGSFGRTLLVGILFAIIVAAFVWVTLEIFIPNICTGIPILCG